MAPEIKPRRSSRYHAKNMKAIITATAPTSYQLNSLSAFGMGFKANRNGSYSASKEFDSEEQAKKYLTKRAEKYNDEDPEGSEDRLNDMLADIQHGVLTLDAVTAYVEALEETDEDE